MQWTNTEMPAVLTQTRLGALAPSPAKLLRWVYFGRVILAVVIFLAAVFSFEAVPTFTIVALAVAAVSSILVSAASLWYTHIRRRRPSRTFLYMQVLFDLALVTTVVHFTGAPFAEFPALYIIVIAVSAVLMPFGSSLLVTALASSLYIADVVWWHQIALSTTVFLQIGVFVGVFLATGLITSRVQAAGAEREELHQEVERLRLDATDILGNLRSGVLTVDVGGKLAYANTAARRLLNLPESGAIGQPFAEVFGNRSPDLVRVIEVTQKRGLKTIRAEGVVRIDRRTFPIGVTTTALGLPEDGASSVTAVFTDISDQKRVEELRLRTERLEAVAELSASLAHEIKNPLASIRSSVEQLSRVRHENEDERSLARLVVRESDRLSRLLSEFLDFSRVQVTKSSTLDLARVARSAIDVVRQHPDCHDDATIELRAERTNVEGDEDLLHRVVVNLVLNAVQAATDQGHVIVEVRGARPGELPRGVSVESAVLLRVSDDCPGIPSELRERLFEPFVTGRAGGTGLGLAIVQRAVQAHRGVVFVDVGKQSGTSFTILLPAKAPSEVAA